MRILTIGSVREYLTILVGNCLWRQVCGRICSMNGFRHTCLVKKLNLQAVPRRGPNHQFLAEDPITKSIRVKVRTSATAAIATGFLHEVRQRLPVRSVQIDGGSEFMQEFETARRDAGIPLARPPTPPPRQ